MTLLTHPDYPSLQLPESLIDFDTYKRNPYRQNETFSLTGSLSLLTAKVLKGERLTLRGGDDFGWVFASTLDNLRQMALSRKQMTLNYRGANYNVVFDYQDGAPIEAEKVVVQSANLPTDYYNNVVVKFILV